MTKVPAMESKDYEETPNSEWTPGPWEVQGEVYVRARDEKGWFPIAEIRGWGHLTGKASGALGLSFEGAAKIQNANARLISAAPEMAEALEEQLHARYLAYRQEHPELSKEEAEAKFFAFPTPKRARAALLKAGYPTKGETMTVLLVTEAEKEAGHAAFWNAYGCHKFEQPIPTDIDAALEAAARAREDAK